MHIYDRGAVHATKTVAAQTGSRATRAFEIWAQDCANCETKEGRVDRIDQVISFEGELAIDQRQRLIEIAEKCPVHRTLTSEIAIVTRLT